MVTHALALSRALLAWAGPESFTVFSSRERLPGLPAGYQAVLSPYRLEVANKLLWFPSVEAESRLDAILYPYWPPPPRRRSGAPPAAFFVHDLAFRLRPDEVPWHQRAYLGTVLPPALRASQSLYEGFGLPLLDAMARGLPALIGDRGALPELAGEAALTVDAESTESIAGGLRRLLGEASLRERLAAAGRRRAMDYSWESAAKLVFRHLAAIAEELRSPK